MIFTTNIYDCYLLLNNKMTKVQLFEMAEKTVL
jgi:hypothetical protein